LHELRAPREPERELAYGGARALDVDEAESRESLLGRLRRERPGPRERVEQRREEQALVDRSHRSLMRAMAGLECLERGALGLVAVAEHPGEPHPRIDVGRDAVRLLFVVELETVLDRTE